MKGGELKDKVASGVAWSIGEKVGTSLLQMGVRIILLRLLMPDDLGVMAILMVFSTFALVVVDSGFSQTLIRKVDPSQEDYKSVFVFNMGASVVLYAALVALSPLVARFYEMPVITRLAPVFFLLLPANALCVIQNTIFTRQFRFALLSKVTFAAQLLSGLAAIGFALAGAGVWSIVAQQVMMMAVRAALLWWLSGWRPAGTWSSQAIRRMAPFSFSLLTTDLIAALYNKIPQLFIGKIYTADTLGYYDQAQKLKDLPVSSTMLAVQGVTFPALSKIQNDPAKFAESYRQVVMVVTYALFPVMAGMSAVAQDMFAVLLGEKWMPTVPYFEVICLAGLFYPVAVTAYNVLKVKASGKLIVQLEVAKKILLTAIFALTIPHSVLAVVWGLVAYAFCEMAINFIATTRFTSFSLLRFMRTVLPALFVTAAMYGIVRLTGWAVRDNSLLRLFAEIAAGAAAYLIFSAVFRLEAYREVVGMIKKQVAR